MKVIRFDNGQITSVAKTPQGYLRVEVDFTRTGVFPYRRLDGSVQRELRSPEEVFKEDSLQTLHSLPATDGHPSDGLLDAGNTARFQVGFTADKVDRTDSDHLRTVLTITDAGAIKKVEDGKREVSLGYTSHMDDTPGEFEGQKYDAIQRRIVGNHLAIVDRARLGSSVRLRMDSDAEMVPEDLNQPERGKTMKITLDGMEIEVPDSVGGTLKHAFDKQQTRIDSLEGELKTKGEETSTLQGKLDSAEEDLKKAKEAAPKLDGEDLHKTVQARVALERTALDFLDKAASEKIDSMEDRAIMEAVVLAEYPEAKLDGKDDSYVQARFDAAVEGAADRDDETAVSRVKAATATRGDARPNVDSAREAMMKRQKDKSRGVVVAAAK